MNGVTLCGLRCSGPWAGKSAFRCCKPVNTTFLVALTAFSMFYLSPDCNKCCFAHLAQSRVPTLNLFVRGGCA